MKLIYILIALSGVLFTVNAQDNFQEVLNRIESNNTTLKA